MAEEKKITLEEAADAYDRTQPYKVIPAEAFKAGAEWQKENPKTADSIPSDCVSDAKCEDRWLKVGDFLPDNGRLVLAQDCLGNTLLARYDGEGNWEVSVYDNDDYYCRNTITKWCEIPSEKQKESLHISEMCKENADSFKWSEEDDRMRLACIDTINEVIDYERDRWEDYNPGKPYRPITKYDEQIDWLKSLPMSCPKSSDNWKPSEEQIRALERAIVRFNTVDDIPILTELRDKLILTIGYVPSEN